MTVSRGWHLWRDDEEMAKKDDDLALPKHSKHGAQWQAARMPRRTWVKRLAAYAFVIMAFVYLFSRLGSSSDPHAYPSPRTRSNYDAVEEAYKQRFDPYKVAHVDDAPKEPSHPHQPPPAKPDEQQQTLKSPPKVAKDEEKKDNAKSDSSQAKPRPRYDGPIRYPALASSLRAIAATGGASPKNRNVLFAAASLKSSSTLLPMACELAMERESYVHFIFMGMADVAMQELLEVNGIDKTCPLIVHDARPDLFETSTEKRMTLATMKALYFVNTYMHPQAIFIDSTSAEHDYFLGAVRDQVSSTRSALIELPERPRPSLAWISKLDSAALSAWNKVRFDILIHATPAGTANLKRLLESIVKADFTGIQTPRITVEIPYVMDSQLESYLANFEWPRSTVSDGERPQMISLRRRITRHLMDEDDSSVRFVESFWPADPANSHVLVLSPHTEVTPQFFQYVKYSLLHQLHSKVAILDNYGARLLGISLSVPTTSIDGSQPFTPPRPLHSDQGGSDETAFLWQRPSSEAMVFTGEKWVELHSLVAQTLYKKRSTAATPALLERKQASKKYPAWLEYALHLSRLRGYFTLYPSRETAQAIIGVHNDIPDAPEEYLKDQPRSKSPKDFLDQGNEHFDPMSPVNMLETLPNNGALQSPRDLPLLSWEGKARTEEGFANDASEYTTLFRKEVGGCGDGYLKSQPVEKNTALDLFCKESKS